MPSRWYLQNAGLIAGPFALEQLQRLVDAGKVTPGMLATEDQQRWFTAREIPGIDFANVATPRAQAPASSSAMAAPSAPPIAQAINVHQDNAGSAAAAMDFTDQTTSSSSRSRYVRSRQRRASGGFGWRIPVALLVIGLAVAGYLYVDFANKKSAPKPIAAVAPTADARATPAATTTPAPKQAADAKKAPAKAIVSATPKSPVTKPSAPNVLPAHPDDSLAASIARGAKLDDAPPALPAPEPIKKIASSDPAPAEKPEATDAGDKTSLIGQGKKLVTQAIAAKDEPHRMELIDQAIKLGPIATEAALTTINKEIRRQLKLYNRQLASTLESSTAVNIGTQVTDLRAKILEVRDREELTKPMIVNEVDPALKQISELMSAGMLAERSPQLAKRREALQKIGAAWERLASAAASDKDAHKPSFTAYLQNEENVTIEPATLSAEHRAILNANAELASQIDPEEFNAVLHCNLLRCQVGLNPFVLDLKLCDAGREHARDMEKLNFFAHESPLAGKTTPFDRAKLFDTTASGENIYMGIPDGVDAHQGWLHSPGHFKNMLRDHLRIGVGRSGRYFAQEFGK